MPAEVVSASWRPEDCRIARNTASGVVREHLDAERVPAATVVGDEVGCHGDTLRQGHRAAAGGEHEDGRAGAEEGLGVAVTEAVDGGAIVFVGRERDSATEVRERADGGQAVPATEVAVRHEAENTHECLLLGSVNVVKGPLKPCQHAAGVQHGQAGGDMFQQGRHGNFAETITTSTAWRAAL
jgi:hypothetical protein